MTVVVKMSRGLVLLKLDHNCDVAGCHNLTLLPWGTNDNAKSF